MYQIYKWRYLYACINSLSWINVSYFVAHCIITNSVAPPLHLILRITHHHTIFFQACGCKGQMHTSGQAVITFISPRITDKTAYMIESEANTCACEQGVVLKRKRPNLSMDRRAWWGVLSHFWEASGSWWSGTTTRQIAFASYCHASRKGCIGIVIVTVHLSETERKKGKWERKRKTDWEPKSVCWGRYGMYMCVCVKRVLRQERQVGLCRWAVDGFISLNQLLRGFPEPWPQKHRWCLQLLIPPQNSNISLNESMS